MLCALSGKDAVVPVVSAVSGKVYERSLIETWIAERGTDPATNTPLGTHQLVQLDLVPANPEITSTTSIPALLQALQSEFNALALENFDLRQRSSEQTAALRESSNKIDAALRVITRLTQERDELRNALEELDLTSGAYVPQPQNTNRDPQGQGNVAPSSANDKLPLEGAATSVPAESAMEVEQIGEDSRTPDSALPELDADADTKPMNGASSVDLLGRDEQEIPRAPTAGDDTTQGILETRKILTAARREFNAKVSSLSFPLQQPRKLPGALGTELKIHSKWAIVISGAETILLDLESQARVEFDWGHSVRHMSFLEKEESRVALLSTRRLALLDPDSGIIEKDVSVQGNPLEAAWHPAGYLVVRFTGKLETYAGDTLALHKELSLSVPKCLTFALHPDGEYIIYHSGASPRSRTLVFYSLLAHKEVLSVDVTAPVSSIATSVNGYHVAFVDGSDVVILDLRSDDPGLRFPLPSEASQLRFDSSGRRLYVSGADLLLVYIPQDGNWAQHSVKSAERSVVAWSGKKLQVPVMIVEP